jgi:GTP-binding protein HflX
MKNLEEKERALLLGTKNRSVRDWEVEDSLEELTRLARTAGAKIEGTLIQELKKVDPALFIGKGKTDEIRDFVSSHDIDLVVFDEELSPTQQSNLEEIFNTKTLDRTGLILDIFAQRAQSKEGKLQVELAQLTYTLPRLKGKGLVLSRLGGGIGTRGPGETQLEVDRRKIKERITRLKREIDKVRKVRELHRQGRQSFSNLTVALIGYTNAGKSTLINNLSQTGVQVGNRLFSTLDPKIGVINLPNNQKVFISDTVGFINKLPHQLVAAFKATFEEVKEADLLLHVIDISSPHFEAQISAVNKVLEEIGVTPKKIIHLLNKIDRVPHKTMISTWARKLENGVAVSALTGDGIENLLSMIESFVSASMQRVKLKIPFAEGKTIGQILGKGKIVNKKYLATGVIIEAEVNRSLLDSLKPYLK